MRMMFGGHINKFDYHMTMLNNEFLSSYLHSAGFVNIRRIKSFVLFNDTSEIVFKG
jgi:predicted SAM-dependent methyltransferase